MLPNKEEIKKHLLDKMTNQDIAKLYGTTFQKIIQLIKQYELDPNELRKVDRYIVYEHWLDNRGFVCEQPMIVHLSYLLKIQNSLFTKRYKNCFLFCQKKV
jgi:hypothetical protein